MNKKIVFLSILIFSMPVFAQHYAVKSHEKPLVTKVDAGVVNAVITIENLSDSDVIYCKSFVKSSPVYYRGYTDPSDINWWDRPDNKCRRYILRGLEASTMYYWELYVNNKLEVRDSFITLPRFKESVTDEFLDTFLISSKDRSLTIYQSRGNKSDTGALIPHQECNANYWSVMHKDDQFRAWGHNLADSHLKYFNSTDGLNFRYQSDALTSAYKLMWGGGLIFDESDEKYKMIYMSKGNHEIETLACGTSPDDLSNVKDIIHSLHDRINKGDDEVMTLLRDRAGANSLLAYTNMHDPPDHRYIGHCAGLTDKEWLIFKHERLGLSGGIPGEETYGMTVTYRNGLYIAFVRSYDDSDNPDGGDEKIDCYLAVSRDGVKWSYIDTSRPVIPLGTDGRWDDGMIFSANPPVFNHGNIDYCYYGGCDGEHDISNNKCQLGLITFRKFGLTYICGDGDFITQEYSFKPEDLKVNAQCSTSQKIKISVLDSKGNEIPGYGMDNFDTIYTDGIDIKPLWNGKSISGITEERFRLKFQLEGMPKLYSYTLISK